MLEAHRPRPLVSRIVRKVVFDHLLPSTPALKLAGTAAYVYQGSGLQRLVRSTGVLKISQKLANLEALMPDAEVPFFNAKIGKPFPAIGARRYRVGFVAGCIANVAFARLNEATLRVLQRNGCEVVIPSSQSCCGALHVHSGLSAAAQSLARNNIDAFLAEEFDAIVTNAAGCGSTLKEYDELLARDPAYYDRAVRFKSLMKDVTEFLASIDLNRDMGAIDEIVTYQDSCHLAHGQKIKEAPRKLLKSIPGLTLREMPMADLCCGSAGIYNVVHTQMAMQILEHKMSYIGVTKASVIATANPGCMLQLRTGARLYGNNQRVVHVVQLLDEAYSRAGSLVA